MQLHDSGGFSVEQVEEVYRGLAAANVTLGGNQERLQGILLATQQVFSKGKVQAEELRGQIGERLSVLLPSLLSQQDFPPAGQGIRKGRSRLKTVRFLNRYLRIIMKPKRSLTPLKTRRSV